MSLQIASLDEKYLQDAAALVAARYRALRQQVPLLPSRYEGAAAILPMLGSLMEGLPGVAAVRGGRLVGFMTGFVLAEFLGKRTAYSPEWANGAEPDDSRRIYQEMYAHLSAHWVADGRFIHVVSMLPNDRPGIEAWHWLGFGLAAVDGVRGLEPVEGGTAGVEVRPARMEDAGAVATLIRALERHLAAAPVFWPHEYTDDEIRPDKPGHAWWLADQGGEAIGCMGLGPANPEACAIIQDEGTVSVMAAFTREQARGRGVATTLLNRALEWARLEGRERCAVDFEPMNVPAARFWMRPVGSRPLFEPVCYSLMRWIDERVKAK